MKTLESVEIPEAQLIAEYLMIQKRVGHDRYGLNMSMRRQIVYMEVLLLMVLSLDV
jgi:hypothetical protein